MLTKLNATALKGLLTMFDKAEPLPEGDTHDEVITEDHDVDGGDEEITFFCPHCVALQTVSRKDYFLRCECGYKIGE